MSKDVLKKLYGHSEVHVKVQCKIELELSAESFQERTASDSRFPYLMIIDIMDSDIRIGGLLLQMKSDFLFNHAGCI